MSYRCVREREAAVTTTDCGTGMGRANERIARAQETYVANATSGWLESLERSLAMMKEYQVCNSQPVDWGSTDFVDCPKEAREPAPCI